MKDIHNMTLFPHQKQACEWLWNRTGGLIWAATGVGKTLIALTYARALIEHSGAKKILIVCPASVKYQWEAEARKFYGIEAIVIEGSPEVRKELWESDGAYKIVNYELLLKDYKYALSVNWDCICADECHRLANARAKTVKIIKKLSARRKLALSATPICNGKYDLFSQLDWISPECLGRNWWSFRSEYCIMHNAFPKIIGYRNNDRFDQVTAPLIHRIGKDVLTDLPPLTESVVPFTLSDRERRIYDRAKKELRIELKENKDLTIANALVKLLRLRQITNTTRPFTGGVCVPSKLSTLIDLLSDVLESPDVKVIMFTSFAETAHDYYDDLLVRWKGVIITGDTPQGQRYEMLETFKNNADVRFILGTEALSTGLNIQAASIVIHIDEPWSYSKYDQRNGRSWRQGQEKHVQVYSLIAKNSVDEYVHKIIEHKKNEVDVTWNTIKEILYE